MTPIEQPSGFDSLGLSEAVSGVLHKAGFTVPTPIQEKGIPVGVTGADLIGIAQTGTGKTMAFALPIIDRLIANPQAKGLVIVPTRELALQVEESVRKITNHLFQQQAPLRTVCLIGGVPIYRQMKDLQRSPRIIIATPGRLQDHLEQKSVDLSQVVTLVLDEADRMLDMGFAPQVKRILEVVPSNRQTMLFSATMAPEIVQLSAAYMKNPTRIEVSTPGASNAQITQEMCYVAQQGKSNLLLEILQEREGSVLVFTRTKHGASKLAKWLIDSGQSAAEIHSNRSLGQRRQALDGFKSGKYRVLVATDVAARGIDVKDISLVVNYDLPDVPEDYVHRIGRTGRAGKTGIALSFAAPDQYRDVKRIERLMNKPIPLSPRSVQPTPDAYSAPRQHRQGGQSSWRSNNSRPQPRTFRSRF